MFAGAAEADWSLPQAELQPGVSWSEVPDWSPGQAPLPQDHLRAPQLRRQVLLHQHAGLLRRDCDPRQSQVWNQSNQQSQKYCGKYSFRNRRFVMSSSLHVRDMTTNIVVFHKYSMKSLNW